MQRDGSIKSLVDLGNRLFWRMRGAAEDKMKDRKLLVPCGRSGDKFRVYTVLQGPPAEGSGVVLESSV